MYTTMPYKKKYPVSRRRRRPTPYKRRFKKKAPLVRNLTRQELIPDSMIIKLKYADIVQINPGAGLAGYNVFRANSPYDPDYTGVGHQPLGWDQWSAFYHHYTVLGSRIKARYMSRSSTVVTGSALCSIALKADFVPDTVPTNAMLEAKDVATGFLSAANARGSCVLWKNYSAKRFHGCKDVIDNLDLRADVTANPTEQAFFHVQCGPQDDSADADPVDIVVEIEYIIHLSERKTLSES